MKPSLAASLRWTWVVFVLLACGYAMEWEFPAQHLGRTAALLTVAVLTLWCFGRSRGLHWRLLYPALAAVLLSVVAPLVQTIQLAFSNARSSNMLSEREVRDYWLAERIPAGPLHVLQAFQGQHGTIVLKLSLLANPEIEDDVDAPEANGPVAWHGVVDARSAASGSLPDRLEMRTGDHLAVSPYPIREVIRLREPVAKMHLVLPDGTELESLRGHKRGRLVAPIFAPVIPAFVAAAGVRPGSLKHQHDDFMIAPNQEAGFFQRVDGQGRWQGERLQPGFTVWTGLDNFREVARFWRPLASQALWSIIAALLITAAAVVVAFTTTWCLRHSRHPSRWLAVLILPSALPLTVTASLMEMIFVGQLGEFIELFVPSQKNLAHPGYIWLAEALPARLLLLLTTIWASAPLLSLWFSRLGDGCDTSSPGSFLRSLWQRAQASVLMFSGSLWLGMMTILPSIRGRPDLDGIPFPMGATDTLVTAAHRIGFTDGLRAGLSAALLLPLAAVALGLGMCRLRLLDRGYTSPAPFVSQTARPTRTRRRWQTLWLCAAALVGLLPLGLLLRASIDGVNHYPWTPCAESSTWCAVLGTDPTAIHWREALGLGEEIDGRTMTSYYPFHRWLANSWCFALGVTALVSAIALSAAWAFARGAFAGNPRLERTLIVMQMLSPALLLTGQAPFGSSLLTGDRVCDLLLGSLAAILLAIPPIAAALRATRGDLPPLDTLRSIARPLTAVALLVLIQQLGGSALGGVLMHEEHSVHAAHGIHFYLFSGHTMWGSFAATSILFSLPVMVLFLLLLPLVDRPLVQHWRP